MKSPLKLLRMFLAVCVALVALRSDGQLTKIRDYKLHQPNDRGVRFATTLTHDHTLITLVAQKDGDWLLTKVGKWWEEHPQEQQLHIRAFSRRDNLDGFGSIKLLTTQNDQFVVSLISAGMKVPRGDPFPEKMIISVVRLDPFQVVASAHSEDLGMRGYLEGFMDPSGQIVVSSSFYPAMGNDSSRIQQTYYRLTLPELHLKATCGYALPTNTSSSDSSASVTALEKSCSGFAERGGFLSAIKMDAATRNDADHPTTIHKDNYLGWRFVNGGSGMWMGMSANSEDLAVLAGKGDVLHRFEPRSMCGKQPVRGPAWICDCDLLGGILSNAIVECNTSHDNLFGGSVGLRQWITAIDVAHERDLSSIEIPIRDKFEVKLVEIGSQRLMLVVLNGSRLEVYSLPAPS